jgi:hypothetical protein
MVEDDLAKKKWLKMKNECPICRSEAITATQKD